LRFNHFQLQAIFSVNLVYERLVVVVMCQKIWRKLTVSLIRLCKMLQRKISCMWTTSKQLLHDSS